MSRRRNGCTGKLRHRSKGAAVATLRRIGNAGLTCYPCRRCGGWHLGTSRRYDKIIARLDQLLHPPKPPPDPQ